MSIVPDDVLSSDFPLFDLLLQKVGDKQETTDSELIELVTNLRKLFSNINNLTNVQNVLFILIRIYNLRFANDNLFDIPFQGQKIGGKADENAYDIKFDIRNFPSKLQLILLEYTRLEMLKAN